MNYFPEILMVFLDYSLLFTHYALLRGVFLPALCQFAQDSNDVVFGNVNVVFAGHKF